MGQRWLSETKSKLGLPRVTMGLNEPLNQSPRGGLEKIGYESSNVSLGNCCKVSNKYLIRRARRTKWRVYKSFNKKE